jgi:phospholipase A-2-activating protein
MYPNEIVVVDEIFIYLSQITASPAQQPSKQLTHVHVEAIIQILDRWPSSQRFPSRL